MITISKFCKKYVNEWDRQEFRYKVREFLNIESSQSSQVFNIEILWQQYS